eukprot:1221894-Rhodomonas_salina.1
MSGADIGRATPRHERVFQLVGRRGLAGETAMRSSSTLRRARLTFGAVRRAGLEREQLLCGARRDHDAGPDVLHGADGRDGATPQG